MIMLIWLLLIGSAQAGTLSWDYDTTVGTIPATATVQRAPAISGPFTNLAIIPSLPSTYPEPIVPTGWLAVYYRIHNDGGDSNVAGYVLPVVEPTPTTTLDIRVGLLETQVSILQSQMAVMQSRVTAAESKLAGICRAAKAMGGSSTSFAGRIRKEVPCP
jgi:hypothetical protein